MFLLRNKKNTPKAVQPLYNTVLDITRFKDGSKKIKCIDYIEK